MLRRLQVTALRKSCAPRTLNLATQVLDVSVRSRNFHTQLLDLDRGVLTSTNDDAASRYFMLLAMLVLKLVKSFAPAGTEDPVAIFGVQLGGGVQLVANGIIPPVNLAQRGQDPRELATTAVDQLAHLRTWHPIWTRMVRRSRRIQRRRRPLYARLGGRRLVGNVTAMLATLREADNLTTSVNSSFALGRNVDRTPRSLYIALLLFRRFIDLLNASRLTPASLCDGFMEFEERLDAHQQPVDVGREDKDTLVVHWRHHRRRRMDFIGEVRGRARLPLHQSSSRRCRPLNGNIWPRSLARTDCRTLKYCRAFVEAPCASPVWEALGIHY